MHTVFVFTIPRFQRSADVISNKTTSETNTLFGAMTNNFHFTWLPVAFWRQCFSCVFRSAVPCVRIVQWSHHRYNDSVRAVHAQT